MPRQIVHIGQRKTGSTWLQEIFHIASAMGVFAYEREAIWRWNRKHDWKSATQADYDELTELVAQYADKDAVISLEGLSMRPPEAVIGAIAAGLPEAKILMVTRNPRDYLLSSFTNNVISGKSAGVDEFASKFGGHLKRSHDLRGWKAASDDIFGKNQIQFLPYELLQEDASAYLKEVSKVIGEDLEPFRIETNRNAAPPGSVLEVLRRINAEFESNPHPVQDMREWNALKYILTNATGYATELHEFFDRYLAHFDMTFELDTFPEKLTKIVVPRMKPLKPRAMYQPYLEKYGLLETVSVE